MFSRGPEQVHRREAIAIWPHPLRAALPLGPAWSRLPQVPSPLASERSESQATAPAGWPRTGTLPAPASFPRVKTRCPGAWAEVSSPHEARHPVAGPQEGRSPKVGHHRLGPEERQRMDEPLHGRCSRSETSQGAQDKPRTQQENKPTFRLLHTALMLPVCHGFGGKVPSYEEWKAGHQEEGLYYIYM